jgi:hypothetical protein
VAAVIVTSTQQAWELHCYLRGGEGDGKPLGGKGDEGKPLGGGEGKPLAGGLGAEELLRGLGDVLGDVLRGGGGVLGIVLRGGGGVVFRGRGGGGKLCMLL